MPPLDHGQLNEMLRDMRNGNADAVEGVYLTVGRRMFALAIGIVKNRADAEDVVQESLLKLVRSVSSFREGTNGYAWVMRIVRNTALDRLRSNRRAATEDLDAFFSLADERYSEERREEALLLENALALLSEEEKRMIYYRYYLDLTVREIARETGMSKSAAARALLRAEEKLRELLHE